MALFFHRLEIGFINSRVKSDEWKKGASSAAASTSFPGSLSLSLSLRKAGRREPWERGCSGFFHNFEGR